MRLLITALFLAQAATAPSFEVASIKPHPVPPGVFLVARNTSNIKIAGNRVTTAGNLKRLVMAAYNVKDFQVDGVPEALESEVYDIAAKTEGDATLTVELVRHSSSNCTAKPGKWRSTIWWSPRTARS